MIRISERKTLEHNEKKIKILYLASLFARMRASTEYSVGARAKSHTSLNHISMNTNTVLFFVFFFSSSSSQEEEEEEEEEDELRYK